MPSLSFFVLALTFFGLFFSNLTPIQSHDLWWHLASGRFIVESGLIPGTDPFSFTAHGQPWINSYWLQEVILFFLYKVGGLNSLIMIKALVVAALVLLTVKNVAPKKSLPAVYLGAFWIFYGAAPRGFGWSEQASLATLLLLSVLLIYLQRQHYALTRVPWVYPVLFFSLWANLHRGFSLGLMCVSVCGLPAVLAWNSRAWRSLWIILLSALGTLLTPWGISLYRMILDDMRLSPHHILGWAATPWSHLEIFWLTEVVFLLAWIIRLRRRSWNKEQLPLVLISFFLGWNANHYVAQVPYFMIWAVPFIMTEFTMPVFSSPISRYWTLAPWAALGGFFVLCFTHKPAFGINTSLFPVDACSYIEKQNLQGRFYEDYSWGGYWMWRFGLRRPVFIDGRYPAVQGYETVYEQMIQAIQGPPEGWQTFLSTYKITGALVKYADESPLPLPYAAYFPRHDWALVYWDDSALIFLKRIPENKECIRTEEFHVVQPDAKPAAIMEHWPSLSSSEKMRWKDELLKNASLHPESRRTEYILDILGIKKEKEDH